MNKDTVMQFLKENIQSLSDLHFLNNSNLPSFVVDFLNYYQLNAITTVIGFVIAIVVLTITTVVFHKLHSRCLEDGFDRDTEKLLFFLTAMSTILLITVTTVGAIAIPSNIMEYYRIKTAPRVYLIEKIRDMEKEDKCKN